MDVVPKLIFSDGACRTMGYSAFKKVHPDCRSGDFFLRLPQSATSNLDVFPPEQQPTASFWEKRKMSLDSSGRK